MPNLFSQATASAVSLTGANQRLLNINALAVLQALGVQETSVVVITATQALTMANAGDVLVDATAGSIVLTLPAANLASNNAQFRFIRNDATANTVTIQRAGTDTIDGAVSTLLGVSQRLSLELPAGQTDWRVISQHFTSAAAARAAIFPTKVPSTIQSINATVAASALTLTLNPTILDFRSSTLTSGTVNTREVASAISLVVPSGATLGTINAVQNQLIVLAIDNAGTIELAVVNIAGGTNLDETTLISTTALSAASDSNNVVYSTTARTNVPFRVVGTVVSTQATAGTWATAPSLIQGAGGQAVASLGSFGIGQTPQDVTGSRALGTTYYNTTGRPIFVHVVNQMSIANASAVVTVGGISFGGTSSGAATYLSTVSVTVPPGAAYSASTTNATLIQWREIR